MAPVTCFEGNNIRTSENESKVCSETDSRLRGDQITCQAAKSGQWLKNTEEEPEKIILTNNKLYKGGILHVQKVFFPKKKTAEKTNHSCLILGSIWSFKI